MISVRPSDERGAADHGWLKTHHTFSFADYYDPKHMGFRTLRVINEDWVGPSRGFDTHPHRDMEIITYVLEGELEHRDSMGNGSVIRAGDVQRMTAGTGVLHSEKNPSISQAVHLFQVWIFPERKGLPPGYEQKNFSRAEKLNRLRLIASRDGREGAVMLHQDADIYASVLEPGEEINHGFRSGRAGWIQVASGEVAVGERRLGPGDGASIEDEEAIQIRSEGSGPAEFLLFDLA